MKFGKVNNPEEIDFSLPPDHIETKVLLSKFKKPKTPNIYVGCAKWNRADLKGFYPRGTKDELAYYSTQFNSIELNATFYRIFPADQFARWYDKTPNEFRFFPKLFQGISHWKRLQGAEEFLNEYLLAASNLKEKLQMPFLQMPDNFAPKGIDRLEPFFKLFPKDVSLAVEFRHTDCYNDPVVASELYAILESFNIANIITDTAGRRDLLHMRMTSNTAFIRYNGANQKSDYTRLDEWVIRLKEWVDERLQNIYFFVHQNIEKESPLLSAYFIKKLNDTFGTNLNIPQIPK
ncbi:DUF72 domain-containing protein [Planktosalinus lacus]|uniref:DUF72 domain-containing protein n=1 Tax=Planktosalinus lacus TaxID=1526573 RepID=A0A8J2VAQ0_9FLAO|nr:DUF72 domain-containing protein [Planktosalinus lacus]GGD94103.1 hypothetical protein GCM10011312_17320 [Planktosalinus lacus]